jgi:omega-amidase
MIHMKVAAIQMMVTTDKKANLSEAARILQDLASQYIDLAVLPEMFICPYQTDLFPRYAEPEGGPSWQILSELAARHGIYLVAGTMPELTPDDKIYNTAYVFDRQGRMIGKHRKMHLFDINITGGQSFKESDTLSPGDQLTVFDTEFGIFGLCICYDFRFPELARLMVEEGAQMIFVPGAFNLTTGPAHWEVLFRSRAIDNQVFTLGCAPARDLAASYHSWGHSILVTPWGTVLKQLDAQPGCLVAEVDLAEVTRVRRELPLLNHRRKDLYDLYWRFEDSDDAMIDE